MNSSRFKNLFTKYYFSMCYHISRMTSNAGHRTPPSFANHIYSASSAFIAFPRLQPGRRSILNLLISVKAESAPGPLVKPIQTFSCYCSEKALRIYLINNEKIQVVKNNEAGIQCIITKECEP